MEAVQETGTARGTGPSTQQRGRVTVSGSPESQRTQVGTFSLTFPGEPNVVAPYTVENTPRTCFKSPSLVLISSPGPMQGENCKTRLLHLKQTCGIRGREAKKILFPQGQIGAGGGGGWRPGRTTLDTHTVIPGSRSGLV